MRTHSYWQRLSTMQEVYPSPKTSRPKAGRCSRIRAQRLSTKALLLYRLSSSNSNRPNSGSNSVKCLNSISSTSNNISFSLISRSLPKSTSMEWSITVAKVGCPTLPCYSSRCFIARANSRFPSTQGLCTQSCQGKPVPQIVLRGTLRSTEQADLLD